MPDQLPDALPVAVPSELYVTLNDQPLLIPAYKVLPPFVGLPDAVIVASVDDVPLLLVPVSFVDPDRLPAFDESLTPEDAVTVG